MEVKIWLILPDLIGLLKFRLYPGPPRVGGLSVVLACAKMFNCPTGHTSLEYYLQMKYSFKM